MQLQSLREKYKQLLGARDLSLSQSHKLANEIAAIGSQIGKYAWEVGDWTRVHIVYQLVAKGYEIASKKDHSAEREMQDLVYSSSLFWRLLADEASRRERSPLFNQKLCSSGNSL